MINQYKVVISSKNIYKEILLPTDSDTFCIGTDIDCSYRLRKELFFEGIRLDFMFNGNAWSVMCSDNIYISLGDARKIMTLALEPGIDFVVKYQNSNNKVFDVEFAIAFESKQIKYDRKIDINNIEKVTIGTDTTCSIVVNSEYVNNDYIELTDRGNEWDLQVIRTTYGVYHNGNRIADSAVIQNGDFFSISDFSFYYKDGSLWTEASDHCNINGLPSKEFKQKNEYPKFTRNTRIKKQVDDTDIEILDPPTKPNKPRNNVLTSLMSSMGMLLTAGAMAMIGGGRMIIMSGISAGMAILTTIVTLIQNKRDYKKDIANRIESYNAYIARKKESIKDIRDTENQVLNEIYISKEEKLKRLNTFSVNLFDRRREDEDFLCVRLGTGNVKAARKIDYKKQEKLELEDSLQVLPEKLSKEYVYVQNAPVICNFKEINALGIVGSENYRYEFLKSIVVDISARHYYSDVKMFLIVEETHAEIAKMFRFLPFLDGSIPNMKNIVCDDESKKIVFEYLYNVLSQRNIKENKNSFWEEYIVFFYDICDVTKHPLSKFIDIAKDLGVTFVFFGDEKKDVPMGCDNLVIINDGSKAELINVADSTQQEFDYEKYEDKEIYNIIKMLAPVKTDEISLEGGLTKNINLFKLLNIFGVEDLDYEKRWAGRRRARHVCRTRCGARRS